MVDLDITEMAAGLIAEACEQHQAPDGGFRIRHRPDIAEADGLRVGFAKRPDPSDEVIAKAAAKVFVAPNAKDLVDGWVLDARQRDEQYRLFLRRTG